MDVRELERKKEQIADAKQELAKAEGAKEPLMKQLKDEFSADTVDEAKAKLRKIEASMDVLEEEFEEGNEELDKLMEGI